MIGFAFGILIAIIIIICKSCKNKTKIYCNDEGWQSIDTIQDQYRDILVTDGEKVSSVFRPDFNKKGQCIFGYPPRLATHWRDIPFPPMNKVIENEK